MTTHQTFTLTPRTGNRRANPAPYLSERASNDDLSAIRRPMATRHVVLDGAKVPLVECDPHYSWDLLHMVDGARYVCDAARPERVFAYLGPKFKVGRRRVKGEVRGDDE